MKKMCILLLIIINISNFLFCQDTISTDDEQSLTKMWNINTNPISWIGFVPVAEVEIGNEIPLRKYKNTTFYFSGKIQHRTFNRQFIITDQDISSYHYSSAAIEVTFRKYYNIKKRTIKGKNIYKNSGNYIAFGNQFQLLRYWKAPPNSPPDLYNDAFEFRYQASLRWGMSRTWKNDIFTQFEGGPIVVVNKAFYTTPHNNIEISPFPIWIEFRLGYYF